MNAKRNMSARRRLTEKRIQEGIAKDPDAQELTEQEISSARRGATGMPEHLRVLKRGRPKKENPKQQVTLRLDTDVVDYFKSEGAGWQTRINEALRKTLSKKASV